MPVIPISNLNVVLDNLVAAYLRLVGSTTSPGNGLGDSGATWGAQKELADALAELLNIADATTISDLAPGINRMRDELTAAKVFRAFNSLLGRLDVHARKQASTSYTTADSLLVWRNTGETTKWQCLQHPSLREMWFAARGTYPSPSVCAFPVVQGATYAQGLGGFAVSGAGTGTFTNGAAVDSSKYAGGLPQIRATSLTGSGNVTVTGVGFNPATKAVTGSVTWITNVTGTGATAMTVGAGTAPADCLLVDVTNISIAAGITAGQLYVEAAAPSRATWPV